MIKQIPRWLLAVLVAACLISVSPTTWAQEDEKAWTVNIRNAEIQAFIEKVAEMTGKNFVVDPRVRARDVTVVSRHPLTAKEVYELFLAVLQVHGYAAVPSGDVIKIVPNTSAKQSNLPLTERGADDGEELITRVIVVENSPVSELVPVLRPLVPQYGHLAAVSSANALIVSDHANNIRRLETIIAHLDGSEAEEVQVVALQHAWAADVLKLIEAMVPEGGGSSGKSSREGRLSVVADERTNRLLVRGDSKSRAKVVELIREMDVPPSQTGSVQVIRLSHADAEQMAELLKGFIDADSEGEGQNTGKKRAFIQPDTSTNSLVIRAEPLVMQEVKSIVKQLDVRRAQILIEAAIVEVGGEKGLDLGFQWAGGNSQHGYGGTSFSNVGMSVNDVVRSVLGNSPPEIGDGATIGGGELDSRGNLRWGGFLQALSTETDVNLLSTPSILTLDNQEASIIVGQNVPFVTGQHTNANTGGTSNPFQTIQREDVGITLTVTPTVAGDRTVRLVLEQEASAVQSGASAAVDLITSKRSINTTVLADDGETIVLGGLIQDDVRKTVQKVPILGSIPVLGALFRSTTDVKEKRNLIVFLRPTILADNRRLAELTQQRYLGVTALQFTVDRKGELKRLVPHTLPTNMDELFDGRRPPSEELQRAVEQHQ